MWLQERVAANHLRVVKIATESNPADMLTKALGKPKVEEFRTEIGQTDPHERTSDKKPKKLKEVKFAQMRSRTSRWMTNCDGCRLWTEFISVEGK